MQTNQLPSQFTHTQKRLLVLLMGLSSTALFAIFPYLSLYLKNEMGLGNASAGLAVGSIALISSCGGWLGGSIVDRIGCLTVIRVACVIYIAAFGLLFFATQLSVVLGLIALIGVGRLLLEPALKTALISHDDGTGQLFRIRYIMLAFGAMAGPLLSVALEPLGARAGFAFAAAIFMGYLPLTMLLRDGGASSAIAIETESHVDRSSVALLVLLGALFFVIFSQFETTLSLHLTTEFEGGGLAVYRRALMINAALSIPMMVIANRFASRIPLGLQVSAGTLCMAVAMVALFRGHDAFIIYAGAALFTVGDVILFPLPDIAAAKLSTPENRGQMIGLIEVRYLGYFIGPWLGGALLERSALTLTTALCVCALAIYPVFLLTQLRGRRTAIAA